MSKLFTLLLLLLSINAFSMLPPWVYVELQDKADEFIYIDVISLSLDTTKEYEPVEYIKTIEVSASVIVTEVENSANYLLAGDTINIGYIWINPNSYHIDENTGDTICTEKIGGGQAPVLEEEQASMAYLNYTDSLDIFHPAALCFSYSKVHDDPVSKSIPLNKYTNEQTKNNGITALPNGKIVDMRNKKTNKELAKGIYLQKGTKTLKLKSN